ncbi:aldehyde dehydrogenase family protein, partial [Vibrio parahaemolyticus V-223/04]
FHHLQSGKW